MQAQDIMTRGAECIDGTATVMQAAKLMDVQDIGFLAVVDSGEVVGALSDRDIVLRCVSAGRDSETTKVRQVMSPHLVFCSPGDSLESVASRMEENRVRRIIVREKDGTPSGIISVGDIAAKAHQRQISGEVLEEVCAHA